MELNQPWLVVVGLTVVVTALVDVTVTTLGVGAGRGPLSDAAARFIGACGQVGRPTHRRLRWLGIVGAAAIPAMWVVLLWVGFALMFLADTEAVVVASSQSPAAALGRVAFAAGALAGAGAGLTAGTQGWQLVNNVAAVVGLAVVTLALTYLFQVVTRVSAERATASRIAGLGPSPVEAVATALRRPGLGTFPSQLTSIAESLSIAAQGHLALPMLQFFHSGDPHTSVGLNLARYDELLSVLEHAVPEQLPETVTPCRTAVDGFLDSLRLPDRTPESPPVPDLGPVREVRDDVPDHAEFERRVAERSSRRRQLLALVQQERWTWDQVSG